MKNTSGLAFAVLILVSMGCACPKLSDMLNKRSSTPPPSATPSSPTSSPSTPSKGDYDVTMAKYDQIKIGTPRSDVERILGGKGTEISNSVGGGVRFSVNKWEGEKYKSIILSFRNDKVMSKSQVGLK